MRLYQLWIALPMIFGLLACQPAAAPSPEPAAAALTPTAAAAIATEPSSSLTSSAAATEAMAPTVSPLPSMTHTTEPATATPAQETPLPAPTDSPAPSQTAASEMLAATETVPTPTPAPQPAAAGDTPAAPQDNTPVAPAAPSLGGNPDGHLGLGAYLKDVPYEDFTSVQQFEQLVGHDMTYVLWFQAWGDGDRDFHADWIESASSKGFTPVITWEPWRRDFANPSAAQPEYALTGIARGDHDDYIRSWAQGAAALDVPIIIRFAHEQSTEPGALLWYPWQGDPEGYRAAYRHIVSMFRQEGAGKVQFLWSAMWLNEWAAQYYPGDDVVDFVGTTILNHGTAPTVDWAAWKSFDELFAEPYAASQQWGKPIFMTELGSAEQGGDKAAWLRDCFTSFETDYPLVAGILLLEVESDREWPNINWSVASSPESLNAFKQAIASPYFK